MMDSSRFTGFLGQLKQAFIFALVLSAAGSALAQESLEPLELRFNKLVMAHGGRVFSARDFDESVKAFRDYDCPNDRPLCSR